MFAISTAASIALGGLFWAWSLHGGDPLLAPRDAARLFGWLCMACTSVGLYFALRGESAYDRGPALVASLAITFLTGCVVLYLSYVQWDPPIALADAAVTSALPERKLDAPAPAEKAARPPRPAAPRVKAAQAKASSPGACAGLRRLAQYQCLKCQGKSGFSGFLCEENARGEYCAGRDGSEPGCPWRASSDTQ